MGHIQLLRHDQGAAKLDREVLFPVAGCVSAVQVDIAVDHFAAIHGLGEQGVDLSMGLVIITGC